jgi:hypothetical protein
METERFCVPELLFNPADIGIDQGGIAETIAQSLKCLDMVRDRLSSTDDDDDDDDDDESHGYNVDSDDDDNNDGDDDDNNNDDDNDDVSIVE